MPRYSFEGKIANDAKAISLSFSGFVAQGQQRQGVLALLLQRRLLLLDEGDGGEEELSAHERLRLKIRNKIHAKTAQKIGHTPDY